MKQPIIRVMVVDDNKGFRESLNLMLESSEGFESAGSFQSGVGVVEGVAALRPDVILMDIDMPGMSGVETVKHVRKVEPEIPILMLTAFEDDENVFRSVCAGATGYLLKRVQPDELLRSIREVNTGGAPMTPSIARRVLAMMKSGQEAKQAATFELSKREKEVLQLLVNGMSYKMIASELGVTYETVHSHIKKIYKTLQVNSATEAVSKSLRNNLLGMIALLISM